MKILRTASLGSSFTGFYLKKSVIVLLIYWREARKHQRNVHLIIRLKLGKFKIGKLGKIPLREFCARRNFRFTLDDF